MFDRLKPGWTYASGDRQIMAGDKVVMFSDGEPEVGVVLRISSSGHVTVRFASGPKVVSHMVLSYVPEDPADTDP